MNDSSGTTSGQSESSSTPTLRETIREVVSETLDGLFKAGRADVSEGAAHVSPGSAASAATAPADVAGQVEKAVAAAVGRKERDAERNALKSEVASLKDKLASMEKAPLEIKRAARFLFGEPEEGK